MKCKNEQGRSMVEMLGILASVIITTCNVQAEVTYDLSDDILTISGEGEVTYDGVLEAIGGDWSSVDKVIFSADSKITRLGDCAFCGIFLDTIMVLPETLTSMGDSVFDESNLEGLVFPNSLFDEDGNLDVPEWAAGTSPGIFHLYCPEGKNCNRGNFWSDNEFTYNKQNGKYIASDGSVIGTYPYKESKRIYTTEEANAVSKPTGNRIKIKYR